MKAINRLLEVNSFKKYKKYISQELIPNLEKYLGMKLSVIPSSVTPYGCKYRATVFMDNKYLDIIIDVTTNDSRLKGDKVAVVDLVVNGRSYPSYIECDDWDEDVYDLSKAFDQASRDFDVNLSLEDDKLEQE